MNSNRLWKHLLVVFVAALALYVAGFAWLEHRRHRLGPWEVSFISEPASTPRIRINQAALQITNVQVEFNELTPTAPTNATIAFVGGQAVPFPVPFGECVFMDPTFLPGTVTLRLFGHEIELLPRTLRVDDREHAWQSEMRIRIGTAR